MVPAEIKSYELVISKTRILGQCQSTIEVCPLAFHHSSSFIQTSLHVHVYIWKVSEKSKHVQIHSILFCLLSNWHFLVFLSLILQRYVIGAIYFWDADCMLKGGEILFLLNKNSSAEALTIFFLSNGAISWIIFFSGEK